MIAKKIAFAASMLVAMSAVQAAEVMPNLGTAPAGWTTDRYDPDSFGNVGTVHGRNDVLGIGISSDDSLANRPAGFQTSFYNTQGKGDALAGPVGSTLSADLYVDGAWRDASAGNVRSDMWAVLSDGSGVTDYGIIGFTNYGQPGARLRVYDADFGGDGWVDLGAVSFDAWNALSIELTGSSMVYRVNGTALYTDNTIGGDHFSSVLMEAYNFGDPAFLPGAVATDYVVNWSNAQAADVPEPASIALMGMGLGFLALRRRKAKAA